MIAFASVIDPWFKRVAALDTEVPEMTPDRAIEVAKTNEPSDPDDWLSEAQNVNVQRGDWVSVTPDDYGNPVCGRLLAWTAEEIVIRHEDPSVGKVSLRFPMSWLRHSRGGEIGARRQAPVGPRPRL